MKRTIVVLVLTLASAVAVGGSDVRRDVDPYESVVALEDVILLAREGFAAETIIAFLDGREIGFTLTAEELSRLERAGVDDEVIRYLIERVSEGAAPEPVAYVRTSYDPGYYAGYYGGYYPGYYYPAYWYVGIYHHDFALLPHHWLGHHGLHGGHHASSYWHGRGHEVGHQAHPGIGHRAHVFGRHGGLGGHRGSAAGHGGHAVTHGAGRAAGHSGGGRSGGRGGHRGGHGGHRGGHGGGHGGHGGGHGGHGGGHGGHGGGHGGHGGGHGGHGGHH